MGSSAKTGKNFFQGSPEHFLDKNAIWDRTPPHLHINCSLHVWGRLQGSQIFKWNSIISIRSKVMAFLVILLSPHGPCCPRVVPTSSLSSPRRPHSPQKVPMWSPWSVVSLHCPRHPHVIPVVPVIPIAPRRSPCGLHGLWSPHVVPIVPTSSPSSPCHPRVIPVIPTSSRRSPHHPYPPDTHSTYPLPPWGVGAQNQ